MGERERARERSDKSGGMIHGDVAGWSTSRTCPQSFLFTPHHTVPKAGFHSSHYSPHSAGLAPLARCGKSNA